MNPKNVTSSGTYDIIRIAFDQNPTRKMIKFTKKIMMLSKMQHLAQIKSNKATRNIAHNSKVCLKIMYTKLSAIVCMNLLKKLLTG
jgi:hypothetical protein